MDDFEAFEQQMSDMDLIDVSNPFARDALQAVFEQSGRLAQAGVPAFRGSVSIPEFPWPGANDPMLGYLLGQAVTIHEDEGLQAALTWLAVHAWFEGGLAAIDYAIEPLP